MIKIGDFAHLAQISIVTLRHYDEIGLFKPVEVDRLSGYRFYSTAQLPRLNRILALKDLGLSGSDKAYAGRWAVSRRAAWYAEAEAGRNRAAS